jgi:SAM-dependent methyltransferase
MPTDQQMPVDRDDVIWCYQNLLGREAESEAAITSHLSHKSFRALVESFTDGSEFARLHEATAGNSDNAHNRFLPLDLPAQRVDVFASDEELNQCGAKIKRAWEFLGKDRAHFSVLTDADFLPENFAGSADRFWASGEAEAVRAERILQKHGMSDLASRICVEYGCGVGRITAAFAKRFQSVYAYDISAPHLAYADQHAAEVGASNITFHECLELMKISIAPCDFFFSIIVFQHNPPPVICELVRRALTALRPGGIALFQVPTYIASYQFNLQEWLITEHQLDMQMHCVPQRHLLELIAKARCDLLEVREDNAAGSPDTILSNTFVVQRPIHHA